MGFWKMVGMAFGIVLLVRIIMKFLSDTDINLKKLGSWAVVTGATDGIGRAFTHELARKGFNIVLISRNREKLADSASFIEEHFHVRTKSIPADFSENDDVMYALIRDELKPIDIGVLVNNVGVQCPHPEYFLELENCHSSLYSGILYCNIWALVNMTRAVLPAMVEKKRGLIINVSSLLHDIPAPLDALYAASKAFVTKFSKDLDLEYRDRGVHIHVLNTGLVATQMIRTMKEISGGLMLPAVSPENYAKSALVDATRKRVCTGHILHTFGQTVANLMNQWLLEKIMLNIMKTEKALLGEICERCMATKYLGAFDDTIEQATKNAPRTSDES